MADVEDVGSAAADDAARIEQAAVLVVHLDGDRYLAVVHYQTAGDDAVQDVDVDVASAYYADRLPAACRDLVEQNSCDRSRARAFGDQFLFFDQSQDGGCYLVFAYCYDIVDLIADDLIRQVARVLDSDAVRKSRYCVCGYLRAFPERLVHRAGSFGLDAVDFARRVDGFDGCRDSREQAAASDRRDDSVSVRKLLKDLKTDRALAGYDVRVVERQDHRVAVLLLESVRFIVGVVVSARYKDCFGAESLRCFDLADRCRGRHAYYALRAAFRCRVSYSLSVVARAAGDEAFGLLFLGQARDLVVRSAELKASRKLQVLCFQIDLAVGAERRRIDQISFSCYAVQYFGGVFYIINRYHINSSCL